MKSWLWIALLVASSSACAASSPLVGVWRSDDTSGGADKGAMVLEANGNLLLQPDGFDPIRGTYSVKGSALTLDLGASGKATIQYRLESTRTQLVARYPDGRQQTFNRITTTPTRKHE